MASLVYNTKTKNRKIRKGKAKPIYSENMVKAAD